MKVSNCENLRRKWKGENGVRRPEQRKDARWEASERKIWAGMRQVIKGRSLRIQVVSICKSAGVKPPTFYRHFANVDRALNEVEGRILREFVMGLKEARGRGTNELVGVGLSYSEQAEALMKTVLRRWLIFVAKNRDYFTMMGGRGNVRLLRESLEEIRGEITRSWASYGPKRDNERFEIFCGAVMGVVVVWGRSDFGMEEMDAAMGRILEIWRKS